jgi:ketosteroid isomerase-like protein
VLTRRGNREPGGDCGQRRGAERHFLFVAPGCVLLRAVDTIEQEVREAEEQLRQAMLANDVEALRKLLHDELTFTAMDGDIVYKDDDLDAHAKKRLKLSSLTLEGLEVKVAGPVAHTSVKANLQGTYDGAPANGAYKYTRSWKKQDGRWQVFTGRVTVMK